MRGKSTIQRSRRMMLCAALFTIYFSLFTNMSASAQDDTRRCAKCMLRQRVPTRWGA